MKTHNNTATATAPSAPLTPTTDQSNGITFAKSVTATSYSFSCTFSSKMNKKVRACIQEEFPKYSKEFLNKVFKKEVSGAYVYLITLKETELEVEYRLANTDATSKKQRKVMKRFNKLEDAIMNL